MSIVVYCHTSWPYAQQWALWRHKSNPFLCIWMASITCIAFHWIYYKQCANDFDFDHFKNWISEWEDASMVFFHVTVSMVSHSKRKWNRINAFPIRICLMLMDLTANKCEYILRQSLSILNHYSIFFISFGIHSTH